MHLDVAARLLFLVVAALCISHGHGQQMSINAGNAAPGNVCSQCNATAPCGTSRPSYKLDWAAQGFTIPAGTRLSCDKSGFCVPPGLPPRYNQSVPDFCNTFNTATDGGSNTQVSGDSKAASNNATLFADTQQQTQVCTPCCDGFHVCAQNLTCYTPTNSTTVKNGLCLPNTLPSSRFQTVCQPTANMTSTPYSCPAPPPPSGSGGSGQGSDQGNSQQQYNDWINALSAGMANGPTPGPVPGPSMAMTADDMSDSYTH